MVISCLFLIIFGDSDSKLCVYVMCELYLFIADVVLIGYHFLGLLALFGTVSGIGGHHYV